MERNGIGILGGTFDPVHFAHLRLALDAYLHLPLQEVRFVPCYQPVHKLGPNIETRHRVNMLQLGIQAQKGFAIDTRELERDEPSYTIITLESFRRDYPEQPLSFIMGNDTLLSLPTWHRWQEIFKLAHIIVAHRPGFPLAASKEITPLLNERLTHNPEDLQNSLAGCIFLQDTELNIASSDIRHQCQQGMTPRYLLPESVLTYIESHGLYQ